MSYSVIDHKRVRDRQLTAGSLLDLGVTDGSKLTLIPVIEAGLAVSSLLKLKQEMWLNQ